MVFQSEDITNFASIAVRCESSYLDNISDDECISTRRILELGEMRPQFYRSMDQESMDKFETACTLYFSMFNPTYDLSIRPEKRISAMYLSLLDPSNKHRKKTLQFLEKHGFLDRDVVRKIVEFSSRSF